MAARIGVGPDMVSRLTPADRADFRSAEAALRNQGERDRQYLECDTEMLARAVLMEPSLERRSLIAGTAPQGIGVMHAISAARLHPTPSDRITLARSHQFASQCRASVFAMRISPSVGTRYATWTGAMASSMLRGHKKSIKTLRFAQHNIYALQTRLNKARKAEP